MNIIMSTYIKKLCRSGETLSIINVYDQNKRQLFNILI